MSIEHTTEFVSRPRDDERPTRKPLPLWDRVKFLTLLVGLFFFFVWAAMADNPLLPYYDAVNDTVSSKRWIFYLGGVELLRQLHYLVSEHWSWYHRLWSQRIFGGLNRRSDQVNPWTRYRLTRVVKWLIALAVLSVILGTLFDVSPALAIFELPRRIYTALPFVFQVILILFVAVGQFAAIF